MERVAYGELQDLRWQLETFGFHALSLEVRQHSDVHAAAIRALRERGATGDRRPRCRRGDRRRGPRRLPGHGRHPRPPRRRGLPSLHHQLHAQRLGRARRPHARRRGRRRDRHVRRRPAPRIGRRARGSRHDRRRADGEPDVPRAPPSARRPPGGHARLLRLDEGVRRARGGLAAPRRRGPPGCGGRAARPHAHGLPRTRRGHRARRGTDEPRHPRERARRAPGPAQAHRAG